MQTHARDDDGRIGGVSRTLLAAAAAAVFAGGCGSGGNPPGTTVPTIDVNAHGRVVLGALGGSTLEVYRVGDYGAPVATTTTTAGPDLVSSGGFAFTLGNVPADAMYLLVATGGQAHDANEDGLPDGPTLNAGKVHALASAADLAAQDVRLSAVTEVVYQRVRYFLQARYDDAYVARACDAWTSFVLRTNVDGVAGILNGDALTFDPRAHAPATFRPYEPRFRALVGRLLAGQSLTDAAFDLSREELAFVEIENEPKAVDLVLDRAYVCRGVQGLDIWNVADPTAPVRFGGFDTTGLAMDVQVVGTLAYVADYTSGLQILDVSNPAAPTLVRTVPLTGWVSKVHVAGNRAYLCGVGAQPVLYIVDVTTPATAALLGAAALGDSPRGVRVAGDVAYVTGAGRVEIVDVSDPTSPDLLGGVAAAAGSIQADLGLGHLFVASGRQLQVFSLALPTAPQLIASLPLPGFNSYGLRIHGTQALLMRGFEGLGIADVSDPANPSFLGLMPTARAVADADAENGLVVATDFSGGYSTLALGTPAPSGVVASLPRAGSVDAVDAVGNRVYVTTTAPNELVVVDSTQPLAPSVLGAGELASLAGADVLVVGPHAYVAESGGLMVYDVSNATAPALRGGDGSFTGLRGLALGTGVVYAGLDSRVATYDVSDPAAPFLLHHLPVIGEPRRLATDGSTIVAAAGSNGSLTLSVATPTTPVLEGRVDMWGALDVALLPPYAFVTQSSDNGRSDRLTVVDFTLPSAPNSPASIALPGAVHRVVRSGSFAYVTGYVAGVNVVDLSTPSAPVHVGTIPVPAYLLDLDVEGGYVYAAAGIASGQLLVLRAVQVAVP